MVTNTAQTVNFFLTDLSPSDKPWDKHKAESVQISNAFALHKDFAKRGYNINQCAENSQHETINCPDVTSELRKYKSLFDDGIITQEEFDAKKKQLLSL